MPRYDTFYEILATRAVAQGGIDIESFVSQALAAGMTAERIQELLLDDLDNDGPLFGRFFRTLTGAAEATVLAAARQGERAGTIDGDKELQRLMELSKTGVRLPGSPAESARQAIDEADPELLQELENASADHLELMWVAELKNTCHRCLPLHGETRTAEEWNQLGFSPETIHEGWASPCYCRLVPMKQAGSRDDAIAPLVRVRDAGVKGDFGKKSGSKRTARAVTQKDLERSIEARNKALESIEGRRTLRLLGKAMSDEFVDD